MTEEASAIVAVTREEQLTDVFVSLADTLVDDYDVIDLLNELVKSCMSLLRASAAGLLLVDQRGKLVVAASSSERTRLLEVFQLQNDEGPCLDCIRTAAPVSVTDLGTELERWPRFTRAALATGFRAVDAFPLRLRQTTIGGLNLFHDLPRPLAPPDRRLAQALADVATIGILQQRSLHRSSILAEQLQGALNSRVIIEQAKGILVERHDIDFDAAFEGLRKYARDRNLQLTEVARAVVVRELDPDELGLADPTG